MTTFTNVFGGNPVTPSDVSYQSITLSGATQLSWPTELSTGPVLTTVVDTLGAGSLTLPDATLGANGRSVIVNNQAVGAVVVNKFGGGSVASVASGTSWFIYLADNSTQAGVWRAVQLGAYVSNATASALAGAGMIAIGALLSPSIAAQRITAVPTINDAARGQSVVWSGSSAASFALPSPAALTTGWYYIVKNDTNFAVTIAPVSGTLDGQTSITLLYNDSAIIMTNGTDFFTVGYKSTLSNSFTFLSINLGGVVSPRTMLASEYIKSSLRFTGALLANCDLVFPSTAGEWVVDNSTTGGFTLNARTATQVTPVAITPGVKAIIYSDGTNINGMVSQNTTSDTLAAVLAFS